MKNIKLFFNIILISMIIVVNLPLIANAKIFEYDNVIYDLNTDYNTSGYGFVEFHSYTTNDPSYDRYGKFSDFAYFYQVPYRYEDQRIALAFYESSTITRRISIFSNYPIGNGYSAFTYKGATLFRSEITNWTGNSNGLVYNLTSLEVTIPAPVFLSVGNDLYEYLYSGTLNGDVSHIGSTQADLGYIKPSYFVDSAVLLNNPANAFEYITWQKESTTGIDITTGEYQVEFMLEDKSSGIFNKPVMNGLFSNLADFVGGVAGSVADFIADTTSWLVSNIFPYGSDERAFFQGKAFRNIGTYGKTISLGKVSATLREFSFSAVSKYKSAYETSGNTSDAMYNFIVDLSNPNGGGFWNTLFDTVKNGNTHWMLTYDIYARIVKGNQTGQWLKINRHNRPLQTMGDEDAINGGVTAETGFDFPNFNPNDTWTDLPTNTGTPQNTDLLTGYHSPDGNNNVVYNNYTYNYDNRTWIENHYDNQTVDDVNQGFDILKNFGIFSNWFTMLFGPLLPDWCVGAIAICSPILVGLIVFRVIKGVIPFV